MKDRTPDCVASTGHDCASALRALAEPSRLEIVRQIVGGERSVSELCAALGAEHHFVSRHLAVLRGARLVTNRRDGPRVLYRRAQVVTGRTPGSIDLGCCEVRFRVAT